jgi:hypothetical protein
MNREGRLKRCLRVPRKTRPESPGGQPPASKSGRSLVLDVRLLLSPLIPMCANIETTLLAHVNAQESQLCTCTNDSWRCFFILSIQTRYFRYGPRKYHSESAP